VATPLPARRQAALPSNRQPLDQHARSPQLQNIALLSPFLALQGKDTPEQEVHIAKRKQVAVEEAQTVATLEAPPQTSAAATAVLERPADEQPARQFRADPFALKTINLEGYKVQLQESRNSDAGWQMQIKFGDGSKDQMPSDTVRDFIKSQKLAVTTKAGEEKEVQMFHWNDADRAWGARIDFNAPATSRENAYRVFNEVVEIVAEERGAGRAR
jgi:hypothetical protein